MITKKRYEGIQTIFSIAGNYSCLFLCMLSIAEEYTGHEIDFIEAYHKCMSDNSLRQDFYCADQEKILYNLTGKKWKKAVLMELPKNVPAKMYTVEKWYNKQTNYTHFKRRGFDTLVNSMTTRNGKVIEYYTYTVEA